MDKIKAPFTPEQVDWLRQYQECGMHPFTCCSHNGCVRLEQENDGQLIPTPEGWVCPCGKYKQDWAHAYMARPQTVETWNDRLDRMMAKHKQYEDLTVDDLHIRAPVYSQTVSLLIRWKSGSNGGAGRFELYIHQDGSVTFEHQGKPKDFCIALMTKVVEKYYK